MPFEMEYEDENGNTYPLSYWIIRTISQNDPGKTGMVHFFGFSSVEKFDVIPESVGIGNRQYVVTDPAIYDAYFGRAGLVNENAYLTILETLSLALDDFFDSANQLSQLKPGSSEIGSQGSSRLIITFPAAVEIAVAGNLISGMHIYVNSVEATISAASRDGTHALVYYDLDTPIDANDVVTWEYDAASGFLIDGQGITLQSFVNKVATNNVGGNLWFDDANNSIWLGFVA